MFVKGGNAPKDADALTAKITPVTIMVHPVAVGVEDGTDAPDQRRSKCPCYTSGSSCSADRCKCKGCGNSFDKRTAGKKDVKKKKEVHQMYVQSFAIEKETHHGFLEGKQLLR